MRRPRPLPSAVALALLVSAGIPRDAGAIILQIDGTICPQATGSIQPGLNKGENGAPYTNTGTPPNQVGAGSKGPIDPIFDASETPQVFAIPKTGNSFNTVTFIDLLEGAGYENTFGWYNVGDDLSDLNNLHAVLTCSPTNYEPTPSGASQVSVNFQTEFAAGRYKGGFVGFFLVTPEGQSGACSTSNCGRADDASCVGRIYYTEKEINGDGNYVHYLIYQTKRTDASGKRLDDYYFGFEDLYRGGDNDFEDMLILVQGLVVPCTPSAEICDGKDNNCDGLIDNNPTDTGTPCYTGPAGTEGVGECKAGTLACASTGPGDTTKTCQGAVVPAQEICDGKDNNCNGTIDDPPFGVALPNACPPQQGACQASTQCVNGAPTCVPQQGPQPEVCDGQDNDCDGFIDNNPTDTGLPCTPTGVEPTQGECKPGTTACVNKALQCQGYQGPSAELCDSKDNNCNGLIDDAPTDLLAQCSPPGVAVCSPGAELCVGGAKVCAGFTTGAPEICDGIDNDCNGKIDDDPVDAGGLCGSNVGACKAGALTCVGGKLECVGGSGPTAEVCDGIDNDCDGFVDEDPDGPGPGKLPGVGDACNSAGGCTGTQICKDGTLLCVGSGGSPEICDGKDNDCNGVIDDNLTDVGTLCGSNVGACVPGVLKCLPKVPGDPKTDEPVCDGGVGPAAEECDGIDNDCDGFIDEDPGLLPGVGVDCSAPGCGAGKSACENGVIVCKNSGGTGTPEVCDGLDNDCDGLIDDDPTDIGEPCGTNQGECKQGTTKCEKGKLVCENEVKGTDEVCNGKDDNCNGVVDEDPDGDGPKVIPGAGEECAPEGLKLPVKGTCKPGKTACSGGKFICLGAVGPTPEVCDGIDNDCDGVADSPDPCPADSQCIAGQCAQPCKNVGEFSDCPADYECTQVGNKQFCLKPGSGAAGNAGQGGASGKAGAGGTSAGGQSAGGQSAGGQSAGGQSAGGTGVGTSAGGQGAGGQGAGGTSVSSQGGAGGKPGDSDGDGEVDNWGLATGGGGCSCSAPPTRAPAWSVAGALALLAGLLRRTRRAAGEKEVA